MCAISKTQNTLSEICIKENFVFRDDCSPRGGMYSKLDSKRMVKTGLRLATKNPQTIASFPSLQNGYSLSQLILLFLSYSNSSFCTPACLQCCFFHPAFECHHLLHNNTGHTHSPQPSPQLLTTLGNFHYGKLLLIEKKMNRNSWNTKLITDSQQDGFPSFCGSFCSG